MKTFESGGGVYEVEAVHCKRVIEAEGEWTEGECHAYGPRDGITVDVGDACE